MKVYHPNFGNFIPLGIIPFLVFILGVYVFFARGVNDVAIAAGLILAILASWYFYHKVCIDLTDRILEYRTITRKYRIQVSSIVQISSKKSSLIKKSGGTRIRDALWIDYVDDNGVRKAIGINAKVFEGGAIKAIKDDLDALRLSDNYAS